VILSNDQHLLELVEVVMNERYVPGPIAQLFLMHLEHGSLLYISTIVLIRVSTIRVNSFLRAFSSRVVTDTNPSQKESG
jgi:hypothetical protein